MTPEEKELYLRVFIEHTIHGKLDPIEASFAAVVRVRQQVATRQALWAEDKPQDLMFLEVWGPKP